jgi:hypothetical protein
MKGNNTIVVNAATLVEAMQEYLNKRAIGNQADTITSVGYMLEGGTTLYKLNVTERKQGAT